jgi:hypothetical protein
MKTTQATVKPPYNEWIAYIHQNVKNIIIEYPNEKIYKAL